MLVLWDPVSHTFPLSISTHSVFRVMFVLWMCYQKEIQKEFCIFDYHQAFTRIGHTRFGALYKCIKTNPPYTVRLVLPCFGSPASGVMVIVYSPLSSSARFLSSRDPVAQSNEILPAYPGSVMLMLVELMMFTPLNLQLTERNGFSGGLRVVVNFTVPATAPLRGPVGNIPSPTHIPD